jgi:hypothetical protein
MALVLNKRLIQNVLPLSTKAVVASYKKRTFDRDPPRCLWLLNDLVRSQQQ